MGIDVHGLNFLRYARKFGNFGKTVTIGRQGIHLPEPIMRSKLSLDDTYKNHPYCEELLVNHFGAESVDSIDNSSYENASIIHDMNSPLPMSRHALYDTVFDGGCLEHIYNITQAFKNCSSFCKPGGQILHVVPANNFCGHGFWQFSPELFFSLYSEKNGYSQTEVFLADLTQEDRWFKVREPKNGHRVGVTTGTQVYALVRTVVGTLDFSHTEVQQSDYEYQWTGGTASADTIERQPLTQIDVETELVSAD
jgi:SAM-dependent methyltransferase